MSEHQESVMSEKISSLSRKVSEQLRIRNETLAVAESLTGGRLAAEITEIAGASDIFLGGFVVYANSAKINQLSVKASDIEKFGVVSKEVAVSMAEGARDRLGSTWALSTTGVAGPGELKEGEIPAGRVWIALSGPAQLNFLTVAQEFNFGEIGRAEVRSGSILGALSLLELTLGAIER
jgi:nicotinamide-nucleotide amidase